MRRGVSVDSLVEACVIDSLVVACFLEAFLWNIAIARFVVSQGYGIILLEEPTFTKCL